MSRLPDPEAAAIGNARALLAALLAGGWRELHVVSDSCEIFIAMNGARENPMRAAAAPPPAIVPQIFVKAPHVATLVNVATEGSQVAKGEHLATLSVLDEEITVTAPSGGIVGRAEAEIGALIEFDQIILRLHEAA